MTRISKMQKELQIQSDIINEEFDKKFPYIIENAKTIVEILNDLSPEKRDKYYNKMARLFYLEFMLKLGSRHFIEVKNAVSKINSDAKNFMDQVCIDVM